MQEATDKGALQQVAQMLLKKVHDRLEDTQTETLTPQAAKHFSSTLKDIRDLQDQEQTTPRLVVQLPPELEGLGR